MAKSALPLAPNPADRRTATRHELELEVGLQTEHNFYTGLTQDVSTGGLFVATHSLKRVGERITLKFKLPQHPEPFEIETEVRWIRESSSLSRADLEQGMGLKFLNLAPAAKTAIDAFCAERDSLFYDDE